ncbi:endonuclease domain-containing protein [Sphingorhabdus arenilitoris]|uniref:Endonuclease domain-containing protein n=1 Tax=Sphingorhabdus arenilitoris TaxID=1490041 RepID=A0ABV8RFD3_9SPHN
MSSNNPSPLAGEEGARAEGVGGRGCGCYTPDHQLHARHALMTERTKAMRGEPTEAEKRLWSILRGKRLAGSKWRNQVNFEDRYIADFVCFQRRLIVEADGGQHSENSYDEQRDRWFEAQGFRVLRFWNNDILSNSEGVTSIILAALETTPSPQTPLPQGERDLRK